MTNTKTMNTGTKTMTRMKRKKTSSQPHSRAGAAPRQLPESADFRELAGEDRGGYSLAFASRSGGSGLFARSPIPRTRTRVPRTARAPERKRFATGSGGPQADSYGDCSAGVEPPLVG